MSIEQIGHLDADLTRWALKRSGPRQGVNAPWVGALTLPQRNKVKQTLGIEAAGRPVTKNTRPYPARRVCN